jgi:hypothetical protein
MNPGLRPRVRSSFHYAWSFDVQSFKLPVLAVFTILIGCNRASQQALIAQIFGRDSVGLAFGRIFAAHQLGVAAARLTCFTSLSLESMFRPTHDGCLKRFTSPSRVIRWYSLLLTAPASYFFAAASSSSSSSSSGRVTIPVFALKSIKPA